MQNFRYIVQSAKCKVQSFSLHSPQSKIFAHSLHCVLHFCWVLVLILHFALCILHFSRAEGFEPPTGGFGDRCSSQLSYTPANKRMKDELWRMKFRYRSYAAFGNHTLLIQLHQISKVWSISLAAYASRFASLRGQEQAPALGTTQGSLIQFQHRLFGRLHG